jgi:hypothetical protein
VAEKERFLAMRNLFNVLQQFSFLRNAPGTVEAQAGTVVEKSAPKRKGRGTFVATLKQLQKSISGSTTQNMEDALVETCLVREFQRLSLADKEAEPEVRLLIAVITT